MKVFSHQLCRGRPAGPRRRSAGLLAGLACPVMAVPGAAWAQAASITTPTLGNVAAATNGVTTFQFDPTGAVTKIGGGAGVRMSTGAVVFAVTVNCSGAPCDKNNSLVTIASTGTPTGRAGSLTNFTVQMGTAKLITGGMVTGTDPVTFTIQSIGKNKSATFSVGADFPINGDETSGASGLATSGMQITVSNTTGGQATISGGSATATVYRSLSMSNSTALNFGRFVRPATGGGTIAMAASTGTLVVGAGIHLPTPSPTRATFTLTGESAQTISVSVPTTITLTDAASDTLLVTTSNTAQGTQQLSGTSMGAAGSFSFYVGGSFPITSTTPSGAYTATFTVTAAYN